MFYPPGSKSEALRLGVHLILLYFIRISLLTPETFFYFDGGWWVVGGGWWMVGGGWLVVDGWWSTTFGFFKSLYNNMVYTLGIFINVYYIYLKCIPYYYEEI